VEVARPDVLCSNAIILMAYALKSYLDKHWTLVKYPRSAYKYRIIIVDYEKKKKAT
jgi:hypothetical protein